MPLCWRRRAVRRRHGEDRRHSYPCALGCLHGLDRALSALGVLLAFGQLNVQRSVLGLRRCELFLRLLNLLYEWSVTLLQLVLNVLGLQHRLRRNFWLPCLHGFWLPCLHGLLENGLLSGASSFFAEENIVLVPRKHLNASELVIVVMHKPNLVGNRVAVLVIVVITATEK